MNKARFKISSFLPVFIFIFLCVKSEAQTTTKKMDSLYVIARAINNSDSSSVLINNLLKETRANNYTRGTINLLLLQAVGLFNTGKFDETIKFTYAIEDEVRESGLYPKISHLLALRANSYQSLFFFSKSNESLKESQYYAEKIKEPDFKYFAFGRIYRLKSNNFGANNKEAYNPDSVIYYSIKSFTIQNKIVNPQMRNGLSIDAYNLGNLFLNNKKTDSAKRYFQIAYTTAKKINQLTLMGESMIGLGQIKEKQNQLDSALFYYNAALRNAKEGKRATSIKRCHELLAAIYSKMGDSKNSLTHTQKYAVITDSIANADKKASSVTAGLVINEKDLISSRSKNRYLLIISGSICFLFILIFAIVKLRKKHSETILYHKEEQNLLNKQLNDLVADKITDEVLNELVVMVKTDDPAFFVRFKEYHPIFIQKITQLSPDILVTDLTICAKLRLGLNTKEIAYFSRSSLRSVESRKYRIRKKLNFKAEDDLATWIVNL
ncbi:tetratricopeptide repeat protein [Pedobacter aquatilis]|uniref:tetratricopeptide repeat protein n=1 Tax=Pedobacter aquatilis TaxID=351343 RepID=UPI00292D3C0D|nr:tetratricopeptide repeat protein [Pedobacter aquatilis]